MKYINKIRSFFLFASNKSNKSKRYKLIKVIGKGAEGTVYEAIGINQNKYAIKIVNLSEYDNLYEINNKLEIQNELRHNNIVAIKESFIEHDYLWIIMRLAKYGTLKSLLNNKFKDGIKDEKLIAIIIKQLLLSIEYCHYKGKIHRDIKGGNILIDGKGTIKLADFGNSTSFFTKGFKIKHNTFTGTVYWIAPEMINQEYYDEKIDIWSMGITMLELAFGTPPNINNNQLRVLSMISNNPAPSTLSYYLIEKHRKHIFSIDFNDFLYNCLHKNPNRRMSASELLQHPFVKKIKIDNNYIKNIFK